MTQLKSNLYSFRTIQADVFVRNNVGTPEQRQAMIDYAQSVKANTNFNMAFNNEGCWRGEFTYPDFSFVEKEFKDIVNSAVSAYMAVDPMYSKKVAQYGKAELNYWTNINAVGSKNSLHDHRLHHFVAVYYLQGKDTGDIVFHNPMNITESCHPHAPFIGRYSYSPEDGDLVVFPAWLPHETEINKSDRERINVAINVRFETPRYIP